MRDRKLAGPWRVEWHAGDRVEAVARLEQAYGHHSALEPVLARLQREGHREGVLLLVDEVSGEVAARRRLDRPVRRRWAPGGRPKRPPDRAGGRPSAAA